MAESKYAARLRELGCTPYHELLSKRDMEKVEDDVEELLAPHGIKLLQRMSRKERRKLVSLGLLPNYHHLVPGCTYITDELGIDWRGPPGLDLTEELGFTLLDASLLEEVHKKIN